MANLLLETDKKSTYKFIPGQNFETLNFSVRSSNAVSVAFTSSPDNNNIELEVVIGHKNETSFILDNTKKSCSECDTPKILCLEEYRDFWIKWKDGLIRVGREGQKEPFLTFQSPETFMVHRVGVKSEDEASWRVRIEDNVTPGISSCKIPLHWVRVFNNEIPLTAIIGGFEGEDVYIGRAQFHHQQTPGKVLRSDGVCYIPWGGDAHPIDNYEVLCGSDGVFTSTRGHQIPRNAFPAGEENGVPLFIGRVFLEDNTVVGKVHPQYGTCYIAMDGEEVEFGEYEIFVSDSDHLTEEEHERMMTRIQSQLIGNDQRMRIGMGGRGGVIAIPF